MDIVTENTQFVVINIPFKIEEDGNLTTKITMEQFNTLNKFIVSHQKRLDIASKTMAVRSKSKYTKPKVRYQFVIVMDENSPRLHSA